MRNPQLKIKIKSLAAEASIIHRDELKYKAKSKLPINEELESSIKASLVLRREKARNAWLSLKRHRTSIVRDETRWSLLAYGYLNNTPYKKMEAKCWESPDWDKVARIILSFNYSIIDNPLINDKSKPIPYISAMLKAWAETELPAS